jgi:predicted RNA binding protein YcfA (HicA-like mRNA interferase family)
MMGKRGGSLKTSMREIAEELRRQGWVVSVSKGGHWRFCPPDKSKSALFMPKTPSDYRGFLNGVSRLRAAGADVRSFKS